MDISKIFFTLKERTIDGEKGKISIDELYSWGVNDKYIEGAIRDNVLEQVDNIYYCAGNVDDLVEYGRDLLEIGDKKSATSVFACAYEIDDCNYNINLQYLCRAINREKPKKYQIINYFGHVYEKLVENGKIYDANYFLFLIGGLYGFYSNSENKDDQLYEKLRNIFTELYEGDILIPCDEQYANVKNDFRKNIFSNSYYKVKVLYDDYLFGKSTKLDNYYNFEYEWVLEKALVDKWLDMKKYINKKLYTFLCSDDINSIKELLDTQDERRSLSKNNEYILKIVNSYLTIKQTGIIPKSKYEGNNIYDAINGNNYYLALYLEENKDRTIKKESYLHIMLKKIVGLIDSLKEKQEEIQNEKRKVNEVKNNYTISLTDKEKQALDSKIDNIHKGRALFLLEPMSQEKRDEVRAYLKTRGDCGDISAFSIGKEPERRIVLRRKIYIPEHIDILELADEANNLAKKGRYEEAAKKFELLLKIGKPRDITYGGYGRTLLKLHRKNEALDCLRVATIMSKEAQNGKADFTELIESIESNQDKYDRKPNVRVEENEFIHKKDSILDAALINDIIALTKENVISIEDACEKLGLSEDTINYIKLICARDYYFEGMNSLGDKYLRQVVRCKKSEEVMRLYKDILVNKNYYCKRLDKNIIFIKK